MRLPKFLLKAIKGFYLKDIKEHLDFICEETPHLTKEYAWWLGKMCEISAVSRVGELVGIDKMTMHRLDFARLRRMFQYYKIPKLKRICVDELYASYLGL